ncbi:MAG: biotin/lipoyl-binding protein [Pirellulaceae bacterium]|nr:biotin/lipoyl-binding protein [Pirellulaceae bacterium]
MSDSIRLADHIWKDGESLVERLQHLRRHEAPANVIYAEATEGILAASSGSACSLWISDRESQTDLAHSGIGVFTPASSHDRSTPGVDVESAAPIATWADPLHLTASERISHSERIGLWVQLEQPAEANVGRALCELAEAVLELTATVYLRDQFVSLKSQVDAQTVHDRWLRRMYDGVTLRESAAAITDAISQATMDDRVCLLRSSKRGYELIASSTQPLVDRRAQQVRLLEDLVKSVLEQHKSFSFTVGAPVPLEKRIQQSLDRYLLVANAKSIQIESISDARSSGKESKTKQTIAAIVMENFRIESDESKRPFATITEPATAAVRLALLRDEAVWTRMSLQLLARRFAVMAGSTKWLTAGAFVLISGLLLYFVPAELTIPVDGHLTAARQQRIFSPVDAMIVEVLVRDGQAVERGDVLVRLRSPELDRLQQSIEGDLATAQTQLAVVSIAFSSNVRSQGRDLAGAGVAAADEKVLQSKIDGLRKQLALVQQQQDSLTLVSSIDGLVNRWDIEKALQRRPVAHGEYLVDVIAPNEGWALELDIPEQNSQYVLRQQTVQPCRCEFRLRSGADIDYQATVERVSDVAMLSQNG